MNVRRYASTLAAFATFLYVALLACALGVLSLYLDLDVVDDPHAGVLAGPIMCAVAVLVVFFGLLVRALRVPAHEHDVAPGVALLLGLGAYVGYAVAGGAIVALSDGPDFLPFVVQQLLEPFAVSAGILAVVVVLLDMIVLSARMDERGRPRWPWERHGDD
jgi:hypothetical protein